MTTRAKTKTGDGLALPAERELLGSLLNQPEKLREVDFLVREDFLEARNYAIYQAIRRLHLAGEEVTVLAVGEATDATVDQYGYLAVLAKDYGIYSSNFRYRALVMRQYATDRACQAAAKVGDWASIVQLRQELDRLKHRPPLTLTARELLAMEFPPLRWIVEGVLPEGVSLLVSPPKVGKTRLATQLAIAIASGGYALNHQATVCQTMDVLYLILESGNRRAQKDLRQLGGDAPHMGDRLHVAADWRRLSAGGAADLEQWLDAHPTVKLVIIDTLAAVRNAGHGGSGFLYSEDYLVGATIKSLADKRGVSVVLIHHSRKGDAEDVLETVSGSTGVTGSVDHILVIKRRRLEPDGTLTLISRDFEDRELALRYQSGLWTLLGPADEAAAQNPDWKGDGQSDERREILALLREEPMTPKDLAEELGKNRVAVRRLLIKMAEAGKVGKRMDGKYSVITEAVHDAVTDTPVTAVTAVTANLPDSGFNGYQHSHQSYMAEMGQKPPSDSLPKMPVTPVTGVTPVTAVTGVTGFDDPNTPNSSMNTADAAALVHGLKNGYRGLDSAALREALGWDEDRWRVAKNAALGQGLIYCQAGSWYAQEARS